MERLDITLVSRESLHDWTLALSNNFCLIMFYFNGNVIAMAEVVGINLGCKDNNLTSRPIDELPVLLGKIF